MYKNIVLSLFFIFLLVLPTFSFAQDTPKFVPGLGTLVIPSGIEVTPSSGHPSSIIYDNLLIKENEIWYSIQIFYSPIQYMAQQSLEKNIFSLNAKLDRFTNDQVAQRPGSKILLNTFLTNSIINNEPSLTKTVITLIDGFVIHTDYYIVQGGNYPFLIGVISSDVESEYWKPTISKILNNIQR